MNVTRHIQHLFYAGCCIITMLLGIRPHIFAQRTIKVACVGNSITAGYGLKDPASDSYPSQLQKFLGAGYTVKNFGVSGATLLRKAFRPYDRSAAFGDMLSFQPDIAIIHLGLNDTDPRAWPDYGDEYMADYSWLIDTIRKASPAVKIFICRLSPIFSDHPRFKSGTRDWFWEIQDEIPRIARANGTRLIDLHAPLYPHPNLFADHLHPNEKGAAILATTVYQNITGNFGGLQLPDVFASHMVVQRRRPIRFYGKANAGEKISASFAGKTRIVRTDSDGKWELLFPAMEAGGPFTATIFSRAKKIMLSDILVGEVWLCSGQSNMAFPLRSAINDASEMERAQANHDLRLFNYRCIAETDNRAWDSATLSNVNRLEYFSGTWQRCDSSQAKDFSAVGYYFAAKLRRQLRVPVGIIQVAVGGSTAESWIDRYTMEHDPMLVNELHDWRSSDFFQPWVRERAAINVGNSNDPGQRHPYEPCYNYEVGIFKFTGFPIQGVIFYQGESNAHNAALYEKVFPALVKSWRNKWGYAFPFYYVQLSSLDRPSWPRFRNMQRLLLTVIPRSGMAVSSDVGDSTNVHPKRKKEVGERLAAMALHSSYQMKTIIPSGPLPVKAILSGNKVMVFFQYAGAGLSTRDGKPLRGCMIRNKKGQELEAAAVARRDHIEIELKNIEQPGEVLYAWKPYTDANLINSAGLPASTFELKIEAK